MRLKCLVVLATLVPAGTEASQVRNSAPADVVRSLVAQDTGGWSKIFSEKPTPVMRQYFTDSFNASWTKAMSHNQDEPVIDGDPITGCQTLDRVSLVSVTGGQTSANAAKFAASLKILVEGKIRFEKVMFDLKFENQRWKIDDIKSGAMQSIRSYFRKSYGA